MPNGLVAGLARIGVYSRRVIPDDASARALDGAIDRPHAVSGTETGDARRAPAEADDRPAVHGR
jgi:hypothetical protein